jgi:hypothetical protein
MMSRAIFLFCLSTLTACASVPGRSPAPVQRSEPVAERPSERTSETEMPVLTGPMPRPETAPEPFPDTSRPSPLPAPAPAEQPATPTSTLLASVDDALLAGDLERAAALSDRALRISPRDPLLWYRRASISYQQQRYSEANGFARRALSFAGQDAALTHQINTLLELTSR